MRKTMSRMADAATAVAGRVVGAAAKGLVNGTQGAADGIRDGWRKGSQSVAGRPTVTTWGPKRALPYSYRVS